MKFDNKSAPTIILWFGLNEFVGEEEYLLPIPKSPTL